MQSTSRLPECCDDEYRNFKSDLGSQEGDVMNKANIKGENEVKVDPSSLMISKTQSPKHPLLSYISTPVVSSEDYCSHNANSQSNAIPYQNLHAAGSHISLDSQPRSPVKEFIHRTNYYDFDESGASLEDYIRYKNEVRARFKTEQVNIKNYIYISYNSDLSVIINTVRYPPELTSRRKGQLLRPVIIDGCAMSSCYNSQFKPLWGVSTTKFAWTADKIISMKPIVDIALLFLVRGHKACFIANLEYYMEPLYQGSIARCKVDDLKVFEILQKLELIVFIEPTHEKNFMERIREEVDKIGGLLISSQDFDRQLESKLRYEQRCLDDEEPKIRIDQNECESGIEYKPPEALTKASLRMLTPSFIGPSKVMVIMFDFHVRDIRGKWLVIPEQENLEYNSSRDKDSQIDDMGRICQQLFFFDQIRLVSTLKDLYELSQVNLRSVQAILRLSHHSAIGRRHYVTTRLTEDAFTESDIELLIDVPELI
uniref:RNase_Zc3h12a_2 domain-containing protein n=1 Tax=Heterorhabditis bacteriophora TaxID=37862 RepID=A0A1I7XAL7_HETBA